MKETKSPRAKLEQEFANLETTRERIIGEIQKLDDHETDVIAKLDVLNSVHETAEGKLVAGRNQWREVESECGNRSLSELWGSKGFSSASAVSIVGSREAKKLLEAEYQEWLKAAEQDEKAKFEAVQKFISENRETIDNRALAHNQSSFVRGLPQSLEKYLNPQQSK